jgi:hypothetical protein
MKHALEFPPHSRFLLINGKYSVDNSQHCVEREARGPEVRYRSAKLKDIADSIKQQIPRFHPANKKRLSGPRLNSR